MANIWKGFPFFTILLLAGLQAIDPALYDAAAVDGAGSWGRFRHGHYRLCAVHHPLVPSDGKITDEHIEAVKPAGPHVP